MPAFTSKVPFPLIAVLCEVRSNFLKVFQLQNFFVTCRYYLILTLVTTQPVLRERMVGLPQ